MRKKTKKALNLANILENTKPQAGDMLISSFLPSTGGQSSEQRHFNSQAEGQDSPREAIMYDYNKKSNGKQVRQFQDGVRIDFSLQQQCSSMQPSLFVRHWCGHLVA